MKEKKDLAVEYEGGKMTVSNPAGLLQLAVKQNLDVEKLEKLMQLQERWEDRKAKKAFFTAMTKFQSLVPELKKSKVVKFSTVNYSYAPLASIVEQIKSPLMECGLSYRWEINSTEKNLNVDCIITHVDGHSEKTGTNSPLDSSGSKNTVQQRGSTITYLQRYTLVPALGLATADSDTDGIPPGNGGKKAETVKFEQKGNKPHKEGDKGKDEPSGFIVSGKSVTRQAYIDSTVKYAESHHIDISNVIGVLDINLDFPDMDDAQVKQVGKRVVVDAKAKE